MDHEPKRRRTSHEEVTIMDLPRVIIVEIISRLPIKSIFCCKRVCKPWYSLPSDPLFVNMHHARSSRLPCLLVSFEDSVTSILELKAQYDYATEPQNRPIKLFPTYKFGLNFVKPKLKLIGSCNGFLCLLNGKTYSKHSLYISNPLLGEFCKLKLPKWGVSHIVYGFCFSESSGQYKVLRSVTKRIQVGQKVTELEVHTLGVDKKWRNVGEAPCPQGESFGNVNVSDSLHWINYKNREKIYSFDIGTEKVKSMLPPPCIMPKCSTSLIELSNCLCLFDNVFEDGHFYIDIWRMKEYGISETWTNCNRISLKGFHPTYKPIVIWKDGEILMQCESGKQLDSYNQKEKQFRNVSVYEVYEGYRAVARYVPSFYSLKTILGNNF